MFLQLQQYFIEHESILRMSSFVVLILLLMLTEHFLPRRKYDKHIKYRRINNLLLMLVNLLAVRLLIPLTIYQIAIYTQENNTGLFNLLSLPLILNILLTIVIFDLLIYIQHVVFHKIRFLWDIHRVHHTDLEFDVTTSIRFHPIEIVLSTLYKSVAVYLIAPVAFAIILYEILLNAAALFTHSNIYLNKKIDALLRTIIVTPDMHRIHHSVNKFETDSNYGNIFSFWDKIFSTYRPAPKAGYDAMIIGLNEFRDEKFGQLPQLLKIPFIEKPGEL